MNKEAPEVETNDDIIIAKSLIMIKEAVLSTDWQKVCDAYNYITEEGLELPQPKKGRIEKIKELMQTPKEVSETDDVKDMPVVSLEIETMTVAEIKEQLFSLDFNESDFKGKNKSQLLEMLNQNSTKIGLYQQGGKNFGKGKIQIITDPYNEELAKKNQEKSDKTISIPVQRSRPIKDNSGDENASFRYSDNPKVTPPWRS